MLSLCSFSCFHSFPRGCTCANIGINAAPANHAAHSECSAPCTPQLVLLPNCPFLLHVFVLTIDNAYGRSPHLRNSLRVCLLCCISTALQPITLWYRFRLLPSSTCASAGMPSSAARRHLSPPAAICTGCRHLPPRMVLLSLLTRICLHVSLP